MKQQINEIKRMQQLAGIITEVEAVASDGGYYNKPEYGVTVSQGEADAINQAIEYFKQDIQDPETVIRVDNSEQGQINWKIIQDLQKNWNVKFENDNEDIGINLFRLASGQNMQDVMDGLDHADQLFYNKIK